MSIFLSFWRSTVGLKVLMALSGAAALGWLVLHMLGNLQAFRGAEVLNGYGAMLKGQPLLLWGQRLGLGLALVVHVAAALQLERIKRRARPERYRVTATIQAGPASRSMRITGPLILLFVVLHLMHFTTGNLHPSFSSTDVFGNVTVAFRSAGVTVLYVAITALVGMHLIHGTRSLFSSIGVEHPVHLRTIHRVMAGLVAVLTAGFVIIPLAAYFGWLPG